MLSKRLLRRHVVFVLFVMLMTGCAISVSSNETVIVDGIPNEDALDLARIPDTPPTLILKPTRQVTPTVPSVAIRKTDPYARAIILFIGDGMGEAHRRAARWSAYGVDGVLAMDTLQVEGMAHTAPYDGIGITDSAAAGTALATGVKTYNGYVGVNAQRESVTSILEIAKTRGYAVGLVTTTQIGHATPACFAAHVPDRKQMPEIVDQMLNAGVDVLLGGGEDDFLPRSETGCYPAQGHRIDDRNLLTEAQTAGYTVICEPADLTSQLSQTSRKVLGLFGDDGMLHPHTPSLAEMTAFAITVLSPDPEGFFLMVEGG